MPASILVVDDELFMAQYLEDILTIEGHNVIVAFDGEEALSVIKENKVDLIILDVMMPKMNGFEVCRILKSQRQYNIIPIIMLTALKEESNRIEGFRVGADEYITKPFEPAELTSIIRVVLDRRKRAIMEGLIETAEFTLDSHYAYLKAVNEFITQLFLKTTFSQEDIMNIKLAFLELGINAIEHGSKKDINKKIHINYALYKDRLTIKFRDEGEGFDFHNLPDPTADECLLDLKGRGIHIARCLMDKVEFLGKGNEVIMTKFIPSKSTD